MALLLFSITSFIDVLLCGSCNINLRGGGGAIVILFYWGSGRLRLSYYKVIPRTR